MAVSGWNAEKNVAQLCFVAQEIKAEKSRYRIVKKWNENLLTINRKNRAREKC